jgi:hypothetical protein
MIYAAAEALTAWSMERVITLFLVESVRAVVTVVLCIRSET